MAKRKSNSSASTCPTARTKAEVRIEAKDGLPADDAYPFAVERADPRPVLFLYSGDRGREAFYYKAALESSATTGLTVQSASIEQGGHRDFTKFAFVVLSDVGDMDAGIAQSLTTYVREGGSLFVALGPNSARFGKSAGFRRPDQRRPRHARRRRRR